mgnify:CR=1 FL=1
MDKISKLLEIAKKTLPSEEILNIQKRLKELSIDELLDALNETCTDNEYHAVIYELVDRCSRGEGPWSGTDQA